jgi:hypothetical protein
VRWCTLLVTLIGCGFTPASSSDANRGDGNGPDAAIDAPPDAYVPPTSPRTITIHANAATALANIPILVALDPSRIDYAQVADPDTDLEFDSPTLTKLFYDVESWNPGGVSAVWVLVPAIPTTNTTLTMSWGHNLGTSNPIMTWSNYEAVLHGDAPLVDPSGPFYTPAGINVTAPDGRAGKAIGFAGTGDNRVTFANGDQLFAQWPAFTLQFWIYADYPSLAAYSGQKQIMDEGGPLNLGRFYPSANGVDLTLQVDLHFTGNNNAFLHADVPLRTWTQIAYVFTGTALRMFENGAQVGIFTMAGGNNEDLVSPTGSFMLGSSNDSFAGALDELEIEQRAHNVDWIHTQYLAMSGQLLTWN